MKERITVRIISGLGYVCHGMLWYSLDDLVAAQRRKYAGCSFMLNEADQQTKLQWEKACENGTAKIAA